MAPYQTHTDQQLIALLPTERGIPVFDEIYKRYWKKLYSEAFKRLQDAALCEEVVQDVFTDLWVRREVRQIDNLLAYLLAAVRYQMFMLYKKHATLPAFEEPLERMAVSADATDSPLFVKELRAFIEQWLNTQPEKRREIFRLRYLDELGTREIAELLGLSQKTVQNQLTTAVKDLKGAVDKNFAWALLVWLAE